VELAQGGASGVEIIDVPARIPGLDACSACVTAKMVHLPHKEGRGRAIKYLERVHVDIAGPMHVLSAGGRLYLYVAVDDCTCAVYTRLLFLKSEAPEAFRVFRAAAENESGRRLCEVMMDNARKLSMGKMHNICKCDSIKLHMMVPYHPASNGVAERAIGVLTATAHAMLHDAGLPKKLWVEAFSMATYLRNRMPMRALDGLTPFELLYGMKPDLADLRAFGALCVIAEPSAKLKKLDDCARFCVFVGYKYGGGGYHIWDPEREVVVESQDMIFFEDSLPPPTLHDTTGFDADADEPLKQVTPLDHVSPQAVPTQARAPSPVGVSTTTDPDVVDMSPVPQHPRLVIRLPGRYMDRGALHHRHAPSEVVASSGDSDSDNGVVFDWPVHNVSHVPDYPERMLCSGQRQGTWDGGDGRSGDGGGDTLFVIDDGEGVDYSLIAFSAGLPGGIHLSQLPDPWSIHEALASPDTDGWKAAMDREMSNLRSHDIYKLTPCHPGMHTLRLGWVLHWKFKDGVFEKNKARLVARGDQQRPGIDYDKSFSPVMRLESLCVLLMMAAICNYDIIQFDVTSAYLHRTLKEEVYMEQPSGYLVLGKEHWVWRLKKGLYGLVQAGRMWNDKLNAHMNSVGYSATAKDPAVYIKGQWGCEGFIAGRFWVDDFVGVGSGKELDAKYRVTGLGEVRWILGMKVKCDQMVRTISILQEAFIDSILACFNLADAAPTTTPLMLGTQLTKADCPTAQADRDEMAGTPYRQLVGALSWLALGTCPDVVFATSSLGRFGHNLGRVHWEVAKRVLQYLKGTKGWRLVLGGEPAEVVGFMDADWGSDHDDRHSVGAFLFKIGGGAVSWKTKKQGCVALSSTEAEYMALCQSAKESVWLEEFVKGLGVSVSGSMVIKVNNQGSIVLMKNSVFHDRLKHIDIQHHYTRDLVRANRIEIKYIPMKDMLADVLTKALPRAQHEYLAKAVGLF